MLLQRYLLPHFTFTFMTRLRPSSFGPLGLFQYFWYHFSSIHVSHVSSWVSATGSHVLRLFFDEKTFYNQNSFIDCSAFALWANAELYILGPSLTPSLSPFLPFSLPHSGRKLKISANIDARTLKFCMRHPWTHSLRFGENQIVCMSVSLLVGLLPYWN